MPSKEFTDERVSKKQRKIDKRRQKQAKKEVKQALDKHKVGWTTQDGKEI